MSTFNLGERSRSRLVGVHPDLVRVVELAITLTEQDFVVLEGVRTVARQHALYGQGRSPAECAAKGVDPKHSKPGMKRVTWTLNSNHFAGRAVDLAPWPIDWEGPVKFPKFDAIAKAMNAAADQLGVPIRWGADWDDDGKAREHDETDNPHFELAKGYKP